MGQAKRALRDRDAFIYQAKFNWTFDFAAWAWFAIGASPMALLLLGTSAGKFSISGIADILLIDCTAALFFGAAHGIAKFIEKQTTVIALTATSLIFKTGLLTRLSREISVSRIEEIELHQSVLGRICGFGTLTIRGEGLGVIILPPIDRPRAFRQMIEEAIVAAENGGVLQAGDGVALRAERAA